MAAATAARWQEGERLRAVIAAHWQAAQQLGGGVVLAWQEAQHQRTAVAVRWQDGQGLRAAVATHWQQMQPRRAAVLAHWQPHFWPWLVVPSQHQVGFEPLPHYRLRVGFLLLTRRSCPQVPHGADSQLWRH